MKAKALALILLLILFILRSPVCRGQAPPQGTPPDTTQGPDQKQDQTAGQAPAPEQPAPPQPGEVRTDVFGRPIFTDIVRADYLNRGFVFWPQLDMMTAEGFHLIGAVKGEYSSNLNLTDENRLDDFITTISAGLRYLKKYGPAGVDLVYLPGYNIYAKNSDLNYWSHFGTLNTYYGLNSRWTLRLRDFLIRTDDPLEYDPFSPLNQYFLSTSMERSPHLRNIAEPQIEYRFGPDDYISLLYRNMYYTNDDPNISDGMENTVNPRLMYWFNVHNGVLLDYSYTAAELNSSPDWAGNDVRARYIYRFNPGTSVFAEYYYANRGFDPPSLSYRIHSPTVGGEHAFSPTFNASLQAGYYVKNPELGEDESSFAGNLFLTKKTEFTTFNLGLIWGFREEYLTPENLGFIEYRRAEINISRQLSARLSMNLLGLVEKADYESDRRDWIYGACAGLTWNALKWLSISPALWYRDRNSNTETFDYREFRGTLRITAMY